MSLFSKKKFSKLNRLAARKWKGVRKKFGLTGKSKFMRQLKRSFKSGSVVAPSSSTSATSEYYHNPRTLSQLMGGV